MDELVVRGGTVVDGTGGPPYAADVSISGGRIVAVGGALDGVDVVDATGCVVAPGFIDIHTHYDAQVFWDPHLTPSCYQGVTTVVAGNCGFSLAPLEPAHRELMIETLQIVEDMSADSLRAGVPWDEFGTYAEYLDAVEARGVGLNFAGYVGHTAVRLSVLGDDAFERSATADEIARMQTIVREAVTAGAIGFATSSNPTHRGSGGRPVPSRLADLDELLALVEPLRDLDQGVLSVLAGERIAHGDVYEVQRHAGRPMTWLPLLVMAGFDHEAWLARTQDARAAGQRIWGQTTCRPIVFQENLRVPFTLHRFPSFAALPDDDAARVQALTDPSWREQAERELHGSMDWDAMTIAEHSSRPDLVGRPIVDVAAATGVSPFEAMLDTAIADGLDTRFNVAVANRDVEQVTGLLQADGVLVGLADSGAHVGQLCDACFSTELLSSWTRERGVFDLETAVHKLTGEPAAFLGFADRGVIRPGNAADLCIFDPDTVAPGPLRRIHDFPADGERLTADRPSGIRHVLVNGSPIRRDGENVDTGLHGSVLRSSAPSPSRG